MDDMIDNPLVFAFPGRFGDDRTASSGEEIGLAAYRKNWDNVDQDYRSIGWM
ncbi:MULTISPECIES: hypothetical protein [Rhizobium]|uniref:Uncharacterized protein n=1 Tax=Rhizobium metallidurans TaxID=1265931 RepID=A0A7W6CTG2_9HYPH|nr:MULTISPECIES: hypothetical protein [Rhizobium]MBB3964129.1 hypothetical protein [Rhizobium metallidurans]